MDDFAPPVGPPPPRAPEVPAGWAARWNEQYKEWFYVNLYTKQSQWEKPTAPVFPAEDAPPAGAPPGYAPGNNPIPTDTKKNPYENPAAPAGGSSHNISDDARLAAQLQAEEDARARSGPGGAQPPPGYGSSSPYPQSSSPYPQSNNPYAPSPDPNRPISQQNSGGYDNRGPGGYGQSSSPFPQELPPREKSKSGGFLGKLLSKGKSAAAGSGHYGGAPHGYPGGGYPAPGGYGQHGGYPGGHQGGYMPQGGYGYPGGHMGGPPMGGHGYGGYGGYPQQRKTGGGGMGMMAGGAALGVGAGLLGGAAIASAMDNDENEAYQDGFEDGADFGGDFDGGD